MTRSHVVAILILASSILAAEVKAEPNPREIIEKAAKVVEGINAISYTASFTAEGGMSKLAPTVEGRVIARRGAGGDPLIAIDGKIKSPGSNVTEPFKFACDGKRFFDLNTTKKVLTVGDLTTIPLMRYRGSPIFPTRYLETSAFKSELTSADLTYVGEEDVAGVACHAIRAVYGGGRFGESTLYIGKDDHLLRKVARSLSLAGRPNQSAQSGNLLLTISDLNTHPEIPAGAFKLTAPEGYRTSTAPEPTAAPRGGRRELLKNGEEAPEFALPKADGSIVSLKDLRGKYVVLDFWATWCGPCKRAMPGLQKLHDHFKDKPVAVFGVNCRERGGDPMRYVKSKGYTYPQLLRGDRAATDYKVSGIPCIYVIDPEGKICFSFAGYHPQMESMITNLIETGIGMKKVGPEDQTARGPDFTSTAR